MEELPAFNRLTAWVRFPLLLPIYRSLVHLEECPLDTRKVAGAEPTGPTSFAFNTGV
jgi:hypothetical protein